MPGSGGNLGFPSRIFREMGADGPVRRQELNVHAFLARLGAQSLSLRPAPGQYIPPPLTPVVIFFACRQRPSGSTRHGLSIRALPASTRRFFSSGRAIRDDERSWCVAARVLTVCRRTEVNLRADRRSRLSLSLPGAGS